MRRKSGNTVSTVWKIAEPIAQELGLSLWDVQFVKEGGLWYLRIYIDKPEGIGIADCEAMSRAINKPLDEADPIEQSYYLEVCSPGINRELVRPAHFQACRGNKIQVHKIRPDSEGVRDYIGILTAYQDGVISMEIQDKTQVLIDQKETAWVRLADYDLEESDS